jgi:hypothetical protein
MRASGSSRTRSTCAAAHAAAVSCVMRREDATDGLAAPALDDVLARARHAASCSG